MTYSETLDRVLTDIYELSDELSEELFELAGMADGTQELSSDFLDSIQRLDMLLEFAALLAPKIDEELRTDFIHDAITRITSYADGEELLGEEDFYEDEEMEWEEEDYGYDEEESEGIRFPSGTASALSDTLVYSISQSDLFETIYEEKDLSDDIRYQFYMQTLY